MKRTRRTSEATAARFRASYERRADKAAEDPACRRQLGAIAAQCKASGRPIPQWVRIGLFGGANYHGRHHRP